VESSCESSNEPSGSIKCRESIEWLLPASGVPLSLTELGRVLVS
jgi:hypothetical protein